MKLQRMRWEEILRNYPEQWVSLTGMQKDKSGAIRSAVVTASAPDLKELTHLLKQSHQPSDRFEYTGSIPPQK